MTAPPREAPAPIRPTVGPPASRAADRLLKTSLYPLILGVCGGAIAVLGHRPASAITAAAIGAGAAAVLAAIGGFLATRAMRFNPWPAITAGIVTAALPAWAVLPRAGLAWVRLPLAIGLAAGVTATVRLGLRYRRRRAAYHRWAQALVAVLAQSIGQTEQVLAGLAKTVRQERVTAPHFGAAPNAAFNLRITTWSGSQIRVAVLSLPAHDDITTPDFLLHIREALTRRAGVKHLRLKVNPVRDEVTITVLDAPEPEDETQPSRREQATDALASVAADALKDVNVTITEWAGDDPEEPDDAGPAWPAQRITITFERNAKLSSDTAREQFRQHLGMQLWGDPSILRAAWNLPQCRVELRKRASFPDRIPCRPLDTSELFGDVIVLVAGYDEDGELVVVQLSHTDAPHTLITGGTGTGKSVLLRALAIWAAWLGIEVRGCDPKRVEMKGLRGWPNVTRIATRVEEMISLIEDTYQDMLDRYEAIEEDRVRPEDLQRILLMVDEYLMLAMLINDYWAEERIRRGGSQPKEHPSMRKLRGLVVMMRGALMNMILATQRGDADIFPDGVRDSIGGRIALGQQSQESAKMMFGDVRVGRDIPMHSQGVGHARTTSGPVRFKAVWLPDPARFPDGFDPADGPVEVQRDLLLAMLPPGSTWEGALPYQHPDPDPGSGDDDGGPDLGPGQAHVRLLFFLREALLSCKAHLTDGESGARPGEAGAAAAYGWAAGPDGRLRGRGTWIGCAAGPADDPRVYLYPARALEVAAQVAATINVPFPFRRADVDEALRASGWLRTDPEKEQRWTVLRPVPGNDLDASDRRQRVWDIPASELLADVAVDPQAPPRAVPALPPAAVPEPAARPGLPPGPDRRAADLESGDHIYLLFEDGQVARAVVWSRPEPDGSDMLLLQYQDLEGDPGSVHVHPDHPIRLAGPGDGFPATPAP